MSGEGSALHVRFEPLPDPAMLEPRWRALESAAAPNFFLGWTWIGSWLRATAARPDLAVVSDEGGADVALALIGKGPVKRLLGTVAQLHLNESGNPAADRVFIEYNAPLCRPGSEDSVARALGAALNGRRDWRTLRLSGVAPDSPILSAIAHRRKQCIDRSPAYCVDLAAVRAAEGDYLSLLSANTRSQIKRSAKDYGPISVARAGDEDTARIWLDAMATLNAGRHADNAWDEPLFRAFAREITLAGMTDGTVDLLRIASGDDPVGYLLNFCCGGRAMNYQSAFAEPVSPKAKPGLMSHAAAVAHYGARGLDLYSLLAGKDRYKESLSTGSETLEWWVLERFSPALEAEYWLRRLLRRAA